MKEQIERKAYSWYKRQPESFQDILRGALKAFAFSFAISLVLTHKPDDDIDFISLIVITPFAIALLPISIMIISLFYLSRMRN